MNVLSRWFRRAPAAPSWVEPAALARCLGQDSAPLIIDVRRPEEFTGPLGHLREAVNMPLNELSAHLPDLVRDNRPVAVVCKQDRPATIDDCAAVAGGRHG